MAIFFAWSAMVKFQPLRQVAHTAVHQSETMKVALPLRKFQKACTQSKAKQAGSRDAASTLESEYRRGRNVPVNGREMEYWEEKKTKLAKRNYRCPRDAYGINKLIDSGWLATDNFQLVTE